MNKRRVFLTIFFVFLSTLIIATYLLLSSGGQGYQTIREVFVSSTPTPTPTITPSPTPTNTPTPTPTPTPNNFNFGMDYDYPPVNQRSGTVRVPVMTYHHIAPLPAGSARAYFVSPTMFETQLQYLKQKNYKTLTPTEFYDLLRSGKNPEQKSVLLTFDDGNADNYTNAFPLLKKYGYVGTFFVPVNKSGISRAQLKEMSDAGMSIESHTKTHIDLTKETNEDILRDEIVNSRYALQNITGQTVSALAYPGCVYNSQTIALDNAAGYKTAYTCAKSIDHKPGGRLAISRMHVYNDMEDFKKRLSGIWEIPVNYPD